MNSKSLFQIEAEYIALNEQIMEAVGEITEATQLALTINENELSTKAEQYSWVIKKNDAECDIIDSEIKRLQYLKKVRENANLRLKDAVKTAMTLYQIDEIKTPLIKINFRKSSSVEVIDLEILRSEFVKTEVVRTADKMAIKKAIEGGEEVLGAELKVNRNLQIK